MPLAKSTLRYVLFATLLVSSVSCDQGTKTWARRALDGGDIPVVRGFWDFHLAQNSGGAFSLLQDLPGGRWWLTLVGLALLVVIFVWMRRHAAQSWLSSAALGLVAGGAIGNLYDRITHGSVTDFIYWHWHARSWPVFNIADAALLASAVLLLLFGRAARPAAAT